MQILINTDHNIEGHEPLADHLRGFVEDALSRYGDRITRVEVHLSDQNGDKGGSADVRCVLEARLARRQPIAVTDNAATVEDAVHGASGKLTRLLETTLGRMSDERHERPHAALDALDVIERT